MTKSSDESESAQPAADTQDTNARRELLEEIIRTQQAAAHGLAAGRSLSESSQRMVDLTGTLIPIVEAAPPDLLRDSLSRQVLSGFREYRSNIDAVTRGFSPIAQKLQTAVSSTMSAAAITITSSAWPSDHSFANIEPLLKLQSQWIKLPTVQQMLRDLHLDVPRGDRRSTVELLQDAERALAVPGSSADYGAAVTVPLREAINVAVDELLKRRPVTSKTGNKLGEKIEALASQCGRITNTPETVARVGESAARLLEELSGTKNTNADRDRVQALFVQGLGVLEDIADLIDASKLRTT